MYKTITDGLITRIGTLLAIALLLASCSQDLSLLDNKTHSAVTIGCKIITPKGDEINDCTTVWTNLEDNTQVSLFNGKVLKAGSYSLYSISGSDIKWFGQDDFIKVTDMHNIVNCEIPGGKHVYGGEIILDTRKSKKFIHAATIENNFEQFKKHLSNNRPGAEAVESLAVIKK